MNNCNDCAIKSNAVKTLSHDEFVYHRENCAILELDRGESIFKEGQFASHIAYLKTGLAKIHKKGVKGVDQIITIVKPKHYIGLQTILLNKTHYYSSTVIEKSTVCYIDIHTFKDLITKNSKFANELILHMCNDEVRYFNRFVNVHQKQINGRLADCILFFANEVNQSDKFVIPLSRVDLAALICTTRESVIRSLKELTDIGAIKTQGKQFEILNKNTLEEISFKG